MFFFQAEDGIRDGTVTGVQTCALPIWDMLGQSQPGWSVEDAMAERKIVLVSLRGGLIGEEAAQLLGSLIVRSEEHTSELQSQFHLVCRLLLEKKKKKKTRYVAIQKTCL